MRGWILIALIGGVIYYFATDTDKLDEPIAAVESVFNDAEKKIKSMTGTKITRKEEFIPTIPSDVIERLTAKELSELKSVFTDNESVSAFKDEYCGFGLTHPAISKQNLQFICDKI
ncbi:hypothetical protein [Shewanella sp. UCD-KL21]|uniref:hypothetical protein n=1 Tax=Shewanella sp. UCD-KL21 TaxID=1917164 RepID=UPI000970CC01|nr:hypothetical protein [Shewanella sp. UCD-KL21]